MHCSFPLAHTSRAVVAVAVMAVLAAGFRPSTADAQAPPVQYRVYVASESADELTVVTFDSSGATVGERFPIGILPTEPDSPHGLALAPDGRFVYSTTAHGTPNGSLWKLDATDGHVVGRVELGSFPASMQLTPDGALAFVVNFNLHGDMVPSTVSVVATDPMVEIARIDTCTMPHGSRLTANGSKHYSTCMMDDILVEIDTHTLAVSRHFMLAPGSEHGMEGVPRGGHTAAHGGHDSTGSPGHSEPVCSPTWAVPSSSGDRVWVACSRSNEIVEVDGGDWTLLRRFPTAENVYNLGVTSDSRLLIATNRRGGSVSIFNVANGAELARIPTLRRMTHGVAISDDDRYAFISVEGVGSEPGGVEVFDLTTFERVADVEVGHQAGGIDVVTLFPLGGG